MTGTIKKEITVAKNKFTLEIYPPREGCNGVEGPYYEIFAHDYNENMGCNLTTIKHICKK